MENQTNPAPRKNSNVIYFLIIVVLALLGTDVYLYLQKNKSDTRIVYQEDEKNRLKIELDSLEAQVEQVNAGKAKMTAKLRAKNDSLQSKITVLRQELAKGKLTAAELSKAQEDVKQLRYFVASYTAQIEEQKKQITSLTSERDTLKNNLAVTARKADTLKKKNSAQNDTIQVAKALKVGSVNIVAYKVRSSGKEVDVTRASAAKKIKINFTIASNKIAPKTLHDVYVRIIDPTGNLITDASSRDFTSDGQSLQSTYKSSIDFKDDGSMFTFEWISPSNPPFQKGTYTVLLYSDNSTMGQSSFTLK